MRMGQPSALALNTWPRRATGGGSGFRAPPASPSATKSPLVITVREHVRAATKLPLIALAATWPNLATAQVVYTVTDLGIIGSGPTPNSAGTAINAAGQVTGYSSTSGVGALHAFRTTPTGLATDPGADLGVIPGLTDSSGFGINSSGQVTGYSFG